MGKEEIERFLFHLAINRKVAVSTQNQAFNAILFLYKDVTTTEIYTHVMDKDFSGLKSPLLELEKIEVSDGARLSIAQVIKIAAETLMRK